MAKDLIAPGAGVFLDYAPAPESTSILHLQKSYGLFIDGEFVAGHGKPFATHLAGHREAHRRDRQRRRRRMSMRPSPPPVAPTTRPGRS